MKRLSILCTIFCASVFAFLSCDPKENEQETPESSPEIIVSTSNGQIVAESADESVTFSYEITNPKDDGIVTLEIPDGNDWLFDPIIDQETKTITIVLTKNTTPEARSEIVTINYTYGENNITEPVNIIQNGSTYDYVADCKYSLSLYYGQGMTEDLNLYCCYFRVSTSEFNYETIPQTYTYSIDLFFEGETEDKLPKPGTYNMVEWTEEINFSFSNGNTRAEYIGDDIINYSDYRQFDFVDGTLTLEKDGSTYNMTAILTDSEGKVHYVKYSGEPVMEDLTILSTLEGDLITELYDYDIVAVDYGDYFGIGMNNWQFQIYNDNLSVGDPVLLLELLTPFYYVEDFSEAPILFDSFYASSTDATSYYIPGEYQQKMSWLVSWGGWGEDYIDPSAALLSGTMLLEPNEDGTLRLTTDFYDQLGNNIKLTLDDMEIFYYPQFSSVSSMSAMPKLPINPDSGSNARPAMPMMIRK